MLQPRLTMSSKQCRVPCVRRVVVIAACASSLASSWCSFAILYATLNFREARRRLLTLYIANALGGSELNGHGARPRFVVVVQALPDSRQLRWIAVHAFSEPVSKRVVRLRALQFVYNGQSVRLGGNFKEANIVVEIYLWQAAGSPVHLPSGPVWHRWISYATRGASVR